MSSPAGLTGASATQSQTPQPLSTSQIHRPLRREGAINLLSAAEQALQDAMMRSSPPPETVLGKRTPGGDGDQDGDTEPDDETPVREPPSHGNITAATLRYATHKKLRAEQRDELETFLKVSNSLMTLVFPS